MKLEEAISLLEDYNRWRRGAEIPQPNATKVGVAISIVLSELKSKKPCH